MGRIYFLLLNATLLFISLGCASDPALDKDISVSVSVYDRENPNIKVLIPVGARLIQSRQAAGKTAATIEDLTAVIQGNHYPIRRGGFISSDNNKIQGTLTQGDGYTAYGKLRVGNELYEFGEADAQGVLTGTQLHYEIEIEREFMKAILLASNLSVDDDILVKVYMQAWVNFVERECSVQVTANYNSSSKQIGFTVNSMYSGTEAGPAARCFEYATANRVEWSLGGNPGSFSAVPLSDLADGANVLQLKVYESSSSQGYIESPVTITVNRTTTVSDSGGGLFLAD